MGWGQIPPLTWPCWVGQVELSLEDEAFGLASGLSTVTSSNTSTMCPPGPPMSLGFVAYGGAVPPTGQAQPLLAFLKSKGHHASLSDSDLLMSHNGWPHPELPLPFTRVNFSISGLATFSRQPHPLIAGSTFTLTFTPRWNSFLSLPYLQHPKHLSIRTLQGLTPSHPATARDIHGDLGPKYPLSIPVLDRGALQRKRAAEAIACVSSNTPPTFSPQKPPCSSPTLLA